MKNGRCHSRCLLLLTACVGWAAACDQGAPAQVSPDSRPAVVPPGPAVPADAGATRARCQRPGLQASELVFLGDSFLALTRALPDALGRHARETALLGSDDKLRDLSVAAAELSNGDLLSQYRRAAKSAPVKVVILNGGLYDLLLGGRCTQGNDARCAQVGAALSALLSAMSADGVQDVVYLGYPDPAGIGARIKPAMDTLRPQLQKLCEQASPIHCQFLDLRATWNGHAEYSVDGVHPTSAGADAAAEVLWSTLTRACIVQ